MENVVTHSALSSSSQKTPGICGPVLPAPPGRFDKEEGVPKEDSSVVVVEPAAITGIPKLAYRDWRLGRVDEIAPARG